jgi:hypothetical protein
MQLDQLEDFVGDGAEKVAGSTLFITFSKCRVNANPSEFFNFLKSGPFSPGETDLRAISSPTSDR